MPVSREEARRKHAGETGHTGASETIYGVICDTCRNYILIDHTNCPPACREHDACRQAYGP